MNNFQHATNCWCAKCNAPAQKISAYGLREMAPRDVWAQPGVRSERNEQRAAAQRLGV